MITPLLGISRAGLVSLLLMVNNRLMITEEALIGLMLMLLGFWGLYKVLERWGGLGAFYYLLLVLGGGSVAWGAGWIKELRLNQLKRLRSCVSLVSIAMNSWRSRRR